MSSDLNMAQRSKSRRSTVGQILILILLLLLVIPLSVIGITLFGANRLMLNILVRVWWLPRGKDILLIYSDSPIWHEYMTNQILPLVQSRAEILNWSERSRWRNWSLAVRVFRSYSGSRDFNPMVILFPSLGKAAFFRFRPTFQEWKHGSPGRLEQMRQDLISRL